MRFARRSAPGFASPSSPARWAFASLLILATAWLVPATGAEAKFEARGSIEQAYVLGAKKGERLTLLKRSGRAVEKGRADKFGSLIFERVRPAKGYRVRGSKSGGTRRFEVLRPGDDPPQKFYRDRGHRLDAGLNYVEVRDGVELAMTVRLPPGMTLDDGPFPTVVEYSGYQVAAPHDLLPQIAAAIGGQPVEPDPLAPATSTAVGSVISPLVGFAVVSVQMRGSGCSGGAFDLFGLPTTYDGYDAIETVAAQPWVRGKVGMVGISFSGITQLYTAGTRPPNLAAVTPMSVSDDIYTATGYPGGIPNSGFARSWINERWDDSRPAPGGGQPWAQALVREGDRRCRANQRLRLQTPNPNKIIKRNPFRKPSLFDDRSAAEWIKRIEVPTFLVGQFQDEQTGGHFAASLDALNDNPRAWITLQNGVHVDSLSPDVITRWYEFLKLYVADEVPRLPQAVIDLSDAMYQFLADAPASEVKQSRFAEMTDAGAARALFEQDPRVRLLLDNGAGPAGPGSIGSAWELSFDRWLPGQVTPTSFFAQPGGALDPSAPGPAGTAEYVADPSARPAQSLPGTAEGDAWKAQPPYDWRPLADGNGIGFTTAPFDSDLVIAGPSSLDLQLASTASDTDVQATISEVRPDGRETFVQSGWLRASHRKLDRSESTELEPAPTHLAKDAESLPRGRPVLVRVPIFPAAHAFRAGSRLRVTIQAPGGDSPRWRFDTVDAGRARNTISLGGEVPTKLVLPVLAGVDAQGTPLPPPTALRGQPSREFAPAANGG